MKTKERFWGIFIKYRTLFYTASSITLQNYNVLGMLGLNLGVLQRLPWQLDKKTW
jgi:hypothetical protein